MRKLLFFAVLLCVVVPCRAQTTYAEETSPTAKAVQVYIPSCLEDAPIEFVRAVLNGDEDGKFELTKGGTHWRGDNAQSFEVNSRTANIRFKGGRTACIKVSEAVRLESDPNQWAALFAFRCLDDAVWKLSIETTPDTLPIPYVRFLPAEGVKTIPCEDRSFSKTGRATLSEVATRYETIYLQFGEPLQAYMFSDLKIERGKAAGTTITASGTTLERADISKEWTRNSRNSPNEEDMVRRIVLDRRLKSVTVKKVE